MKKEYYDYNSDLTIELEESELIEIDYKIVQNIDEGTNEDYYLSKISLQEIQNIFSNNSINLYSKCDDTGLCLMYAHKKELEEYFQNKKERTKK